MIVPVSGFGEAAFLRAASVSGIRGGGDLRQVAPGPVGDAVVLIGFSPAECGACGIRGSRLRRNNSVELVVGECL